MNKIEIVPMDNLTLDPRNVRKGNVAAIADSLSEFGQHRAVVAQRGTGKIIAGNHLYLAAQQLGWTEIGVFWVEDDDITAIRRSIADNATGDLASWELPGLAALVAEVGGDIPGLDEGILARFKKQPETTERVAPVYPVVPKFDERYECVVVVATNNLDWAFLAAALQLDRAQSYKNNEVGVPHVISVERLRELLSRRRKGEAGE